MTAVAFALFGMLVGAIGAGADVTGKAGPTTEGPALVPNGSEPTDPVAPAEPGGTTPPTSQPKQPARKKSPAKKSPAKKKSSKKKSTTKKKSTKKKSSTDEDTNDSNGSGRDDSNADDETAADPLDLGADGSASDGPVSVPNLVLQQFQIPPFLLPIYQAAGIQYGIRWEILASINEIETNYGRNLNVSSAGALGWMQFMPATWEMYGVDANNDGVKDPYNPVDAIFAAANYLKAAGGHDDLQKAIFAYNHAQWYVDQVMLRAKLIAGVPDALIDSLTGLTQGHFPVYAKATYAGAIKKASTRVKEGNAARVVEGSGRRNGIKIYSKRNAPVVAVQDAVVKQIGRNTKEGNFITIEDTYGNRYRYTNLGSISKLYPVPRSKNDRSEELAEEEAKAVADPNKRVGPRVGTKERVYAHPERERPKAAGTYDGGGVAMNGYETFDNYFARPYGLKKEDVVLKPLKKGSKVIGGTILGRLGVDERGRTPYVNFQVRPAGSGAPVIDPKPILDGWKLLESTAVYRAIGLNPLVPDDASDKTIGQLLLMSKEQLEEHVLKTKSIEVYEVGREQIRGGLIDRRVLALLAFLDSEGFHPTVTSLYRPGAITSSGNVSQHSHGTAVDIAAINGKPTIDTNEPGDLTEQTVRKIMTLQGTLNPDQIISLFDIGGATLAMGDHADHIHVGFQPGYGVNANGRISRNGRERSVLSKKDWFRVFDHLGKIENPEVSSQPSAYSIKVKNGKKKSE